MEVPFHKMDGAGNDYVLVDAVARSFPTDRAPAIARYVADRAGPIGADGLILLLPGTAPAHVGMRMWNADGSEGAMCGNGLRCLAALAAHLGLAPGEGGVCVQTPSGLRAVWLGPVGPDGFAQSARAEMGEVRVDPPRTLQVCGEPLLVHPGNAGNPHAVVFVDGDLALHPVARIGAALQRHEAFPDGVNVEFVAVDADGIRCRVHERGSGETLACGTGATVAALASRQLGLCSREPVPVRMRGGELLVHLAGGGIVLEGPVRHAYRSVFHPPPSAASPAAASQTWTQPGSP